MNPSDQLVMDVEHVAGMLADCRDNGLRAVAFAHDPESGQQVLVLHGDDTEEFVYVAEMLRDLTRWLDSLPKEIPE